jgi:pyruvate/2-oxoacid:ferredoxin oxidoreductase beta subunit
MPIDIAWEALVRRATFVARSFAGDPKQVKELIVPGSATAALPFWISSVPA